MDSQELRDTFHRVNAYRQVTEHVRSTAGRTLFNGVFMLGLSYFLFSLTKQFNLFMLAYTALGVLEIIVGLWKKFAPAVECILAESIVNFLFGASLLLRQALIWQQMLPGQIMPISIIIGLWSVFDAYRSFMAFLNLRKHFVERPSAVQMKYVAGMMADIRDGQPEEDPSMLDFSSELDFKAQMLGDLAFLIDRGGELHILEKENLIIENRDGGNLGRVILFKNPFPPIIIRDANWQNYCRWKGLPLS